MQKVAVASAEKSHELFGCCDSPFLAAETFPVLSLRSPGAEFFLAAASKEGPFGANDGLL